MALGRKAENLPAHNSESEEGEEEGSSDEDEEESSESESESQEDEVQTPQAKLPVPVPVPVPAVSQKPSSAAAPTKSSSSEELDSDSESDSPPANSRKPDPNIKPIASKPMDEPPSSKPPTKKPRSKPSEPPTSPPPSKSTKRPGPAFPAADTEVKDSSSKRAKRKVSSTAATNGESEKMPPPPSDESPKKQLFQRLWSEDDEIVILKGMLDYSAKKGLDPNADMNAFHDFIKKSLHVDVSKTQLVDKIRRLKKKFENQASKEKKGKARIFSKEHDQKAYDLSKKIWGNNNNNNSNNGKTEAVETTPKVNGNSGRKTSQRSSKAAAMPNDDTMKMNGLSSPRDSNNVAIIEADNNEAEVPAAAGAGVSSQSVRTSRGSLEDEIVKDGLELIKGPKRAELEEKWKQLHIEEVELYLKRVQLIGEQTKLVLEALRCQVRGAGE